MPTEAPVAGQEPVSAESPAAGVDTLAHMPDTNLVGVTWEWQQRNNIEAPAGSLPTISVANAENYTLLFNEDGTFAATLDCNSGSGRYATTESMTIRMELGPSTLAACPEGSLATDMTMMFGPTYTYNVSADGNILSLEDAAAGTVDFFGRQGSDLAALELFAQVGLHPSMISLDTQGLPYSWQPVLVPTTPYDESQPPGPTGLPAHIEILFGVSDPSQRQPSDPIMYIIPVDAYRIQWDENDNPAVSEAIDDIFSRTNILNVPELTPGYAALPFNETVGALDVAAQLDRTGAPLSSATISGYRFTGRWQQSPNPVTNQGLRYVYQGFTNDGRYLVSFFYPITSPTLPMTAADVPAEEMDALNADPAAYLAEQNEMLNELEPSDFEPDLATLDALVGSLEIEGMSVAGIEGPVWQPAGEVQDLEDVPFTQDTGNYSVTYTAEDDTTGVMNFQADCNVGAMPYTLNQGGMVGGYLTSPGPMTLAACGEDSLDQQFVGALQAAQNYRVRPGGTRMELALPAGGPTYVFDAVARHVPLPTPTPLPPVEVATPDTQTAYGRVIAPLGVNVRTGPGSEYETLGVAPFGTVGDIIGQSADGAWWVVHVEITPDNQGWVSADFVEVVNGEGVPVLEPSGSPPTPVPAATPIPTATPAPMATAQPVTQFSATEAVIAQGECTTLVWNVANIQAVWVYPMGQPYKNYPVTGQGREEVCPQQTTTYEMRVLLRDGTVQTQTTTIEVVTENVLANTGWALATLYGAVPLPQAIPNLFFYDDPSVAISGGCNSFAGPYEVSGSSISIGPLSGSLIVCEQAVSAQEAMYLNAVQSAVSFDSTLDTLILRDGSGQEVARFTRLG